MKPAWASFLMGAVAIGALAQPAPPADLGDAQQRRQLEQTEAHRERMEAAPWTRTVNPPAPDLRLPEDEQPCVVLHRITWQTDHAVDWPWLDATVDRPHDAPLGRCIGAAGAAVIAQRAQGGIAERGFITTRVLIEPQSMGSGELRLSVRVGRVGQVRAAPAASPRATLWNAAPLAPGDVLNLRDIEQALENLQRVPSASAEIRIEPTDTPSFSDVIVMWTQDRPVRLSLSADDSGLRNTGRYQGSVTLSLDHVLGLNDLLYLTVQNNLGGSARGAHGTRGGLLHYSLPLGHQLLSFTASRNRCWQTVAGATQDYLYACLGTSHKLSLSHMAHRGANHKTTVDLSAFARRSHNFVDDTEVVPQRRQTGGWELGASHRLVLAQGTLDARLSYLRGTGAFGSERAPEESFGEGTSRMGLWTADAGLTAALARAALPLSYSAQLRAQVHQTRLTPQDRFAIGGRHSVRGFDGESNLSGDSGWTLRQEIALAIDMGEAGDGATSISAYLGLDRGCVNGPGTAWLAGRCLTGAAIGLRGNRGSTQFDAFAGRPVRRPEGFRTARTTWGFQLHTAF